MLLNPLRKKIQASTCSGPQDVVQENQIDYLASQKPFFLSKSRSAKGKQDHLRINIVPNQTIILAL